MKKTLLLSAAAALLVSAAQAQVGAAYGLASSVSSEPIVAGANVVKAADAALGQSYQFYFSDGTTGAESWSDVTGPGYAIGFDFNFAGQTMKYFAPGAAGVLKLGSDENVSVRSGKYLFVNSADGYNNIVAFASENGCFTTGQTLQISYELQGETPNRELVVTYQNYALASSSWADNYSDSIDFQIVLCESGEMKFRTQGTSKLSKSYTMLAGLRGVNETDVTAITGNFDAVAHAKSANCTLSSSIAEGSVYTMTLPADVVAPTAQPTELIVSELSATRMNAEWTACDAEYYLVVVSEGALTDVPQACTVYGEGTTIGNGTVVTYTDKTNCRIQNLMGSTDYVVTVFASNYYGLNGPQYNVVAPLTQEVTTTPTKPGVITFTDITADSFTFDVAANEMGDQIFVVVNDSTHNPGNYGVRCQHGEISAAYQTGDAIDGGGRVAYFGPAAEGIKLEGLTAGQDYYFLAYSYNEKSNFSVEPDTVMAAAITTIRLPWAYTTYQNSLYNAPTGWTTELAVEEQGNAGTLVHTDASGYDITARGANGHNSLLLPVMEVNQLDATFSFDMATYTWSRFSQPNYNFYTWKDDDQLYSVVHTAEASDTVMILKGEDFIEPDSLCLTTYTVDLTNYYDQQVQVEVVFDCSTSIYLLMESFHAEGTEPEPVKIETIEQNGALRSASGIQYDLQGRPATSARGIQVRNGQLLMVK